MHGAHQRKEVLALTSNGTGLSVAQTKQRLKSIVKVPRFVTLVTVDAIPFHLAMWADEVEAIEWACSMPVKNLYKEVQEEGPGHFVRMTFHVVVEDEVAGLPQAMMDNGSFEVWTLGKLPLVVNPLPRISGKNDQTTDKPKTTAKKPVSKKAAPAKKPVASTKAAAAKKPRRGAGAGASTKKRPTSKTPARATRRK